MIVTNTLPCIGVRNDHNWNILNSDNSTGSQAVAEALFARRERDSIAGRRSGGTRSIFYQKLGFTQFLFEAVDEKL